MMTKKVAVVYCSNTGNTKDLVKILFMFLKEYPIDVSLHQIDQFPLPFLNQYDAIIIGTYTWGNGEIPQKMKRIYHEFELQDVKNVVTGVAGTGDSFYPEFCGAVDKFRDMLFVHTNLTVTLKVELTPQLQDIQRCQSFVEKLMDRVGIIHSRKITI